MLSYQERKKFLEFKNDVEHALHRGSAASGTTNVKRAAFNAQIRGTEWNLKRSA